MTLPGSAFRVPITHSISSLAHLLTYDEPSASPRHSCRLCWGLGDTKIRTQAMLLSCPSKPSSVGTLQTFLDASCLSLTYTSFIIIIIILITYTS